MLETKELVPQEDTLSHRYSIYDLCSNYCKFIAIGFFNLGWKDGFLLIVIEEGAVRFQGLVEMDSARSWLHKFQPREKGKSSSKKKDGTNGGDEDTNVVPMDEASLSSVTKQKVAAAKQYIENHYKEQMKNLQERKERYVIFVFSLLFHVFISACLS